MESRRFQSKAAAHELGKEQIKCTGHHGRGIELQQRARTNVRVSSSSVSSTSRVTDSRMDDLQSGTILDVSIPQVAMLMIAAGWVGSETQ